MDNTPNKKRISGYDIAFLAAVISVLVFVFWRLPRGYARSDESYYITMAWRFVRGDVMIIHERNSAQFFALLLYPFVKAYLAINGSTEGIILAGRYLYLTWVIIVCLCLYIRFRKSYPTAAIALSVMLLLYVPNQIMATSYYTLGLVCTLLLTLLLVFPCKNKKAGNFLMGLLYSVMVLCNPLMILMIFAVVIIRIISTIKNGKKLITFEDCYVLFGIVALAAPYIVYLLLNAPLKDIIDGLISIVTIRTEVTSDNLIHDRLFELYARFIDYRSVRVAFYYTIAINTVIILDKNRKKRRLLYSAVSFVILGFLCVYMNIGCEFINYTVISLCCAGTVAYNLLENKNKTGAFWVAVCTGIWFLVVAYTTDQGFLTCSVTLFIPAAAGLFAITKLFDELKSENTGLFKTIYRLSVCLLFAAFVYTSVIDRINMSYQDGSPREFDTTITEGPMKGLITSRERVEEYYRFLEETKQIREHETGRVHYQTASIWLWMCDEKMPGSMSVWWKDNLSSSREYYEKNPDFIPECVFIEEGWGTPEQIAPGMGITPEDFEKTELGYIYIK